MTTSAMGTLALPIQVRDWAALEEIFAEIEIEDRSQLEAPISESEDILDSWQETGWKVGITSD